MCIIYYCLQLIYKKGLSVLRNKLAGLIINLDNDQIVPLNADKSLQYFKEAQLMGRKGLRGKNTCKSLNPNKM